MHPGMIYEYPIWAVGLSMLVSSLLATYLLERIVNRFASASLREEHNETTAAIMAAIGVTYAVLLAFVAMLAWQGFDEAKAATSHEAAIMLDVNRTSRGFDESTRMQLRENMVSYLRTVIAVEWPNQAQGHVADDGDVFLDRLERTATALRPGDFALSNLQARLLDDLTNLRDARQKRLLSAEPTISGIVWFVLVTGGALTIGFGCLLGASSLRLHLSSLALLACSGVLVLVMILALSNPFRGDFRVSEAPFAAALARMQADR